jgi:endosialidase-like protein
MEFFDHADRGNQRVSVFLYNFFGSAILYSSGSSSRRQATRKGLMKRFSSIRSLLLLLVLAFSIANGRAAVDAFIWFSYQGFLSANGTPANGSYDMTFTLFRQGETAPGPSVTIDSVPVALGVFTVRLDFGQSVFDGTAYELGIAVRPHSSGGGGTFVDLQPRQLLTATPYANHARSVSSVPDSALSANVALLNGSPMFTTPVRMTTLRVADASGGGALNFGNNPDNVCAISIEPQGPSGLLLRDPSGIRILSPDAQRPPTLRFGPTDDCSIGIDPAFPGLVERDPIGFRLLGQNNTGSRLIFGPTMLCTIETSNSLTGLILRDPNGLRLFSPTGPTNIIRFGPTDNCQVTADPNGGLRFSDPRGFTFGNQVTVNGPVFAQAFVQTSSRRFKNDVKPIEKPLEKISQLKGVRFTWNEEKGGQKDIGFIAEDVAKVIPELVSWEEDGENARGVNYDHLVAVAIEGIKAQQSQIETLEQEKAELKQSLASMKSKLDTLSEKLEKLMAR